MEAVQLEVIQPATTKKSRLPRFKRVRNPPRMVLTERDREILRRVYEFRIMTREQIERLLFSPQNGQDHFTKTSQVRRRLKLLYHHKYLERIPVPVRPGFWAWRPVYRLGKRGAEIVASEIGTTSGRLPYWGKRFDDDQRSSDVGFLFLSHTLAINDVRIQVISEAKAKRFQVETWIDDTALKAQFMKETVSLRQRRAPVIPDAYFVLNLGDRRAHFFLELDRGTMTLKRWQRKVLDYKAYVQSGAYQEQYHTRSLRVLTVATSRAREENLKKATEEVSGNQMFWFTTVNETMEGSICFSPIWKIAGTGEVPSPLIF